MHNEGRGGEVFGIESGVQLADDHLSQQACGHVPVVEQVVGKAFVGSRICAYSVVRRLREDDQRVGDLHLGRGRVGRGWKTDILRILLELRQ